MTSQFTYPARSRRTLVRYARAFDRTYALLIRYPSLQSVAQQARYHKRMLDDVGAVMIALYSVAITYAYGLSDRDVAELYRDGGFLQEFGIFITSTPTEAASEYLSMLDIAVRKKMTFEQFEQEFRRHLIDVVHLEERAALGSVAAMDMIREYRDQCTEEEDDDLTVQVCTAVDLIKDLLEVHVIEGQARTDMVNAIASMDEDFTDCDEQFVALKAVLMLAVAAGRLPLIAVQELFDQTDILSDSNNSGPFSKIGIDPRMPLFDKAPVRPDPGQINLN